MTFTNTLARQAERTPDDIAIDFIEGTLTFADLYQRVCACIRYLNDNGIRPGQRLGICFADERLTLITALAATRIGAVICLVPHNAPDVQKTDMGRAVDLDVMLTDDSEDTNTVWRVLQVLFRALDTQVSIDPETLPIPDPESLFMIVHGSGSTGNPKLLPSTHAQIARICDYQRQRFGNQPGDVWASFLYLHYRTALLHAISAVTGGNTFVRRVSAVPLGQLAEECRKANISFLYATPSHAHRLLQALPDQEHPALSGLKGLILSFASVQPALRAEVRRRLTPNLYIVYGSNEVGVMTILPPDAPAHHGASVGYVIEENTIEVAGSDGQPLPPETAGEIRVRNDQNFTGYIGDPEATANAVRDGWFYPGDSGMLLPDGQLVHLGRSDHMMIYRGVNIYPAEIEQVVSQIEGVTDVAVVPLPHPERQDAPACAFTLEPNVDLKSLNVKKRLAQSLGVRAPETIILLPEIPRNAQGKLNRKLLYEWIEIARRAHAGKSK